MKKANKLGLRGRTVYISGPVGGRDRATIEHDFAEAERLLGELGAIGFFNPVAEIDPDASHEVAMRIRLSELCRRASDGRMMYGAMVQLPGWAFSIGSRLELTVAEAIGIEYVEICDLAPNSVFSIENDVRKNTRDYWGCKGYICDECPALIDGKTPYRYYSTEQDCGEAQVLDLLRRQRELLMGSAK